VTGKAEANVRNGSEADRLEIYPVTYRGSLINLQRNANAGYSEIATFLSSYYDTAVAL